MHHFPLHRSSHPTSPRSSPPPSVSSDQATHPSFRQDANRIPWWCMLRGRGGLLGGGWRGLQKPSCHLGGRQQVSPTTSRVGSYGRPFSEHLPLCSWYSPPISSSSSEQSICTELPLMQWHRSQLRIQGSFFCLLPLYPCLEYLPFSSSSFTSQLSSLLGWGELSFFGQYRKLQLK